jgi:hypothetical protein
MTFSFSMTYFTKEGAFKTGFDLRQNNNFLNNHLGMSLDREGKKLAKVA